MRHAAVSISITTLTDALAFLIGAIAPLPAVKYFCFYSCAAIIFIFFFCLTMFVACLSLQGRLEKRNRNSLSMGPVKDLARLEKLSLGDLAFHMGSFVDESIDEASKAYDHSNKSQDNRMWYQKFFEDCYAPFIANRWTVLMTVILFGTYATVAAIGSQRVIVGFDVS
ncbi:hypothetical protein COOONC_17485 [Cooperia oncophora]